MVVQVKLLIVIASVYELRISREHVDKATNIMNWRLWWLRLNMKQYNPLNEVLPEFILEGT